MFQYDMLARSLASGNGFRWYDPADRARLAPYLRLDPAQVFLDPRGMLTTFRAPLYPALLSIVYSANGINDGRFFAARLAQTLLGAMLAPLTYLVARLIPLRADASAGGEKGPPSGDAEMVPRLASWLVVAYPTLVLFPVALATENLFFLLVLASVWALLQVGQSRGSDCSILFAAIAGILLGLSALTRSVILPFAGLAILWIWFSLNRRLAAIAALLALIFTILPWIIRNSVVEHQLTGIESSLGYNLYIGYHPESTGTFVFGPSLDLLSISDDKQRDVTGTQMAIGFIRQDPWRFPALAINRLGYFFNLELRAFTYFYVNDFFGFIPFPALIAILLVLALPFFLLSLSAAFGWSLLGNRPESALLLLLLVGYLLPHVLILSEERFHLTLIPFIAIPAAAIWVRGFRALRDGGPWTVVLSFVIVVLLLANWGFELAREAPTFLRMLGPGGNQLYLPY